MSQSNVETLHRIFAAFARGDMEAALLDIDPDVIFEPQRSATEGAFVGHAGIRRFWKDTMEMFGLFDAHYGMLVRSKDYGDEAAALEAAGLSE